MTDSTEYTVPALSPEMADTLQALTGDRSNLICPLYVEDEPLGAIVYIKKVEDDFREEQDSLEIISRMIALAIRNALRFEALQRG